MPVSPVPIPGRSLSSPNLPQAGDGASSWLQEQTRLFHRCLSLEFQRDEAKTSLAQGQVCIKWCSSSGSGTKQRDGAQPVSQEQPAQGIVLGGCGSSDAWGGQGMKPLLTLGQSQTPITLQLLPFAGSLSGAGWISSCHKINWQLNVVLLLALSKEMKLFVVL